MRMPKIVKTTMFVAAVSAVPEVNDSQLEYIVMYVRAVQKANGLF